MLLKLYQKANIYYDHETCESTPMYAPLTLIYLSSTTCQTSLEIIKVFFSSTLCYFFQEEGIDQYELFGTIVHIGGLEDGHYYAFVKKKNGKWYRCADTTISEANISCVKRDSPYILFYRRISSSKQCIFGVEFNVKYQ